MSTDRIQVLIVDDSAIIRGLMTKALSQDREIEVSGSVMHGEAALHWLKTKTAQVVVLDVEMPVMDGLETLKNLRLNHPDVKVIMASSLTQAGAKTSLTALSLGAAACIAKPTATSATLAVEAVAAELIPLMKALTGRESSRNSLKAKAAAMVPTPPVFLRKTVQTQSPQLLVIGSSTGGPNALTRVLSDLGPDFSVPTVIVQHMPRMFTGIMAHHLQCDTGRRVKEAEDGEFLQSGVTYIAPGDFHLELRASGDQIRILLHQQAEEHFCRPSVNPLFRTAARVTGKRTLAVMLTGMGSDGLEGTQELVAAGAYVLAQDLATSVVWGMPGSIVQAGLVNEVLPLQNIGPRIVKLCAQTKEVMKAACHESQ